MRQYLDLMERVLSEGVEKRDRTGVGTRSIFGHQLRFDLNNGFPLITTKKLHVKSIIYELLWFLRGDTNVKYLDEHGVSAIRSFSPGFHAVTISRRESGLRRISFTTSVI